MTCILHRTILRRLQLEVPLGLRGNRRHWGEKGDSGDEEGLQKVGEASRWPSRLLSSGSSMASRVFKGNEKLLYSSRSWS